MKFKKQANVAFFSKYVREDGKFTITSVDRRVNGTLKNVIAKYFNNSYLSALSSLVSEEDISLDDLKQLIREVENAHNKK